MSELFSDAFHEEREVKVYGKDIISNRSLFSFEDLSQLPESKSNNVSFMKVEELDVNCRNLLLTSDSYVCYSVTQKKNLLRAIDTITGEKSILRGHEGGILDLALSPQDHTIFCSVDNNNVNAAAGNSPHVFVWKKRKDSFSFDNIGQLSLKASIIQAHPLLPSLWAMAEKDEIAVFSSNQSMDKNITSYTQLGASYKVDHGTVTGLTFTPDGNHLIASVQLSDQQSVVEIFRLSPSLDSSSSTSDHRFQHMTPLLPEYHRSLRVKNLVSVQAWEKKLFVVVKEDDQLFSMEQQPSSPTSNGATDDKDLLLYTVQIYDLQGILSQPLQSASTPKVVQSVTFSLPAYESKSKTVSSSLQNPALECALSIEAKKGRYMVLTSRRSSYLAIFALLPSDHPSSVSSQSIYHITLLNLKAPIVSHSLATVLGREHHSLVEDEYMEVSAYQEEAAEQASIQQYHIHLQLLFNYQQYILKRSSNESDRHDSDVVPPPPLIGTPIAMNTPSAKGQTILGLLQSASAGSISSGNSVGSGVSDLRDQVVVDPITTPSSINNISSSALKPIGSRSKLIVEADNSLGAVDSSLLRQSHSQSDLLQQVQTTPRVEETTTTLGGSSLKIKKIDRSALFPTPASTANVVSDVEAAASVSPAQPVVGKTGDDLPSFLQQPVNKGVPILQMLRPKVGLPTSAASTPSVPAPALATMTAPLPASSGTTPRGLTVAEANTSNNIPADVMKEITVQMEAMFSKFSQQVQRANQTAGSTATGSGVQTAADLLTIKEEIVKEVQKSQTKSHAQLTSQLRSVIDQENKKVLEVVLAQKEELTSHLQEIVNNQLVPSLANKLKDSAKDAMKQTVNQSFRSAFETALIPAFQAGMDRMFGQLSVGFEQGMRRVSEECQQVSKNQEEAYRTLQSEVGGLKETVAQLEQVIQQLVHHHQHLAANGTHLNALAGGGSLGGGVAAPATPMDLVKQGKIHEGVRRALDMKDVDTMVTVLSLLQPQTVNEHCSPLTRLCITQQLAADMSANMPKEGLGKRVDWIKHLVLSLLNVPLKAGSTEDESFAKYFKSMISVVLQSIKAAQEMITRAQFDNGEDDENEVVIPQSASTDLLLLEHLIQTKV